MAIGIVAAQAAFAIQQAAGNAGQGDGAFVIFQLVQTTLAAAITERFPFLLVQLGHLLGFPKTRGQASAGDFNGHRPISRVPDRNRYPFG